MKKIILARGLPGLGKTTFAESICETVFSADQYFEDVFGNYNFNADKLGIAHAMCQKNTELAMSHGKETICVANTFTTSREMKPYFELAEKYGYTVFSVIVENRHGGVNVHNVPAETLEKMQNRFNVQL